MSSKPRPLKLRMPFPCAPEALELQFFEFLLLQCSQQAVFQASASEAADFLCFLSRLCFKPRPLRLQIFCAGLSQFYFSVALPGLPPSCARVAQA